jgi:predicted lipoprotein with Yx(FWY)xxD motif
VRSNSPCRRWPARSCSPAAAARAHRTRLAQARRRPTAAARRAPERLWERVRRERPDDLLGTFLVDGRGRALDLRNADHGSRSTCKGAGAQAGPPLTATATPKAGGAVKSSLLGTAMRADGSREVLYAGHSLYTFTGDTAAGRTAGEGSVAFVAP